VTAGWRLALLYLVSRRVPMALALLAGLGALLWSALHWHSNIAGGPAAQLFIPLTIQAGAAAVIALTTFGPFGDPERAAGRWLPWLRLGTAVALTAVAFGALVAAAAAGGMPGGTFALLRNLGGMTGVGRGPCARAPAGLVMTGRAGGYGRDGLASCASWRASCGNQAPAAGSSMPHSGSKAACPAASAGQAGWV
jgi:hypothetical protein